MTQTTESEEIEIFEDHIAVLMRLAEEMESVYAMEFLSIARDCYRVEHQEFMKRNSRDTASDGAAELRCKSETRKVRAGFR